MALPNNRGETSRVSAEALGNGAEKPAPPPPPAPSPGGMKPWIPLIANVVLMPVLAYVTTAFLLLPRLQPTSGKQQSSEQTSDQPNAGATDKKGGAITTKVTATLGEKILVNVAGTMATRYLVASVTLVGKGENFKANVKQNDPQLRDVAASVLSSKTITDLEKPGARNLIRTELIAMFNTVLGEGAVTDLYLTEFAVQ